MIETLFKTRGTSLECTGCTPTIPRSVASFTKLHANVLNSRRLLVDPLNYSSNHLQDQYQEANVRRERLEKVLDLKESECHLW